MSLAESQSHLYHQWLAHTKVKEEPAPSHSTYFGRTGVPWDADEVEYLVNWYAVAGPTEIGYALERTPVSVRAKAYYMGLPNTRRNQNDG